MASAKKRVKAKKKCCGSRPRCKRCNVTLKRLAKAGHAERLELRAYRVAPKVPKAALRAARAR